MSDSDNEKINKVKEYISSHEWNTLIWQVSEIKTEIDSLKTEVRDLIWGDDPEEWLLWNLIDILGNNKTLLEYAKLKLKDDLTWNESFKLLEYEVLLTFKCSYFSEFKKFLKNLKEWGDVSRDTETQTSITPEKSYNEDEQHHDEQMEKEQQKWNPKKQIESEILENWREAGARIPAEKLQEVWGYISHGWTFYSPSKWTVKWWKGEYKHVCSTWSYNVLWKLWFPKVSNSLNCDLDWTILPKMWLEYICEVDPDDPEKNWYKPQDWDTAVWPRFTRDSWKKTQHQATYINGSWVSDTIQNNMYCYWDRNEPRNVKIYRYKWGTTRA